VLPARKANIGCLGSPGEWRSLADRVEMVLPHAGGGPFLTVSERACLLVNDHAREMEAVFQDSSGADCTILTPRFDGRRRFGVGSTWWNLHAARRDLGFRSSFQSGSRMTDLMMPTLSRPRVRARKGTNCRRRSVPVSISISKGNKNNGLFCSSTGLPDHQIASRPFCPDQAAAGSIIRRRLCLVPNQSQLNRQLECGFGLEVVR
jgi:hypothetical protein